MDITMSAKTNELRMDIAELNLLQQHANRQRIKDMLAAEITKLQTELTKLVEESKGTPMQTSDQTSHPVSKCYEVKLNNYSWDETSAVMKLYITLNKVHEIPKENVICNFTKTSVELRVLNLENKNYHLLINNLCENIEPTKSHIKIKTDMIIISLVKDVPKIWSCVTGVEKKLKDAKTVVPEMDKDDDPGANLMNIMKDMYQKGNDEMKRTIAKAWTENQNKQAGGRLDFPEF